MPFYEIQHSTPLTPEQRQSLAERITDLHAITFTAPRLFVNVRFTSLANEEDYFYGGKQRPGTNRIVAFVRSGGSRSSEMMDKLAEEVEGIWDDVVKGSGGNGYEKVLQAVAIVPGLTTREEGFAIPAAGEEPRWLKENMDAFKKRADAGDEDFQNLLAEVESRPELMGVNPSNSSL